MMLIFLKYLRFHDVTPQQRAHPSEPNYAFCHQRVMTPLPNTGRAGIGNPGASSRSSGRGGSGGRGGGRVGSGSTASGGARGKGARQTSSDSQKKGGARVGGGGAPEHASRSNTSAAAAMVPHALARYHPFTLSINTTAAMVHACPDFCPFPFPYP
jgi:hypothetical protein